MKRIQNRTTSLGIQKNDMEIGNVGVNSKIIVEHTWLDTP